MSGVDLNVLRTPFHARTQAANRLNLWHSWKGYTVANAYHDAELEYFAVRNATGVFDLSPMTKYRVRGPDATAYLDRLMTRDMTRLAPGRVAYAVWCNDAGKVLDDGTVFCFASDDYRICSQERHLEWFSDAALGFDVTVTDETAEVAALAVQGPTSCAVLMDLGVARIDTLKPFGLMRAEVGGMALWVSRTGFTGDLGYELWLDPTHAEDLWDALFDAGRLHGIAPIGGDALEMARIEAGYIQAGVDFLPAHQVVRPGRTRSPFELGLGWLVDLSKDNFNGLLALRREYAAGSRWQFLRLNVEGNKPAKDAYIYAGRQQVGFVTSALWSPVAKQNIALASVALPAKLKTAALVAEIYYRRELHWSKVMAPCEIVEGPFWDPPRRRATPPAAR